MEPEPLEEALMTQNESGYIEESSEEIVRAAKKKVQDSSPSMSFVSYDT